MTFFFAFTVPWRVSANYLKNFLELENVSFYVRRMNMDEKGNEIIIIERTIRIRSISICEKQERWTWFFFIVYFLSSPR